MPDTYRRILATEPSAALLSANAERFRCIDMHTGGEPLRVVIGGMPAMTGDSILELRRRMRQSHDHIRKLLMWEPRGHADMYGLIPLPPERPDSDFGVLFLHNEGYSTMCGHATLAIAKLAVQLGWVDHDGKRAHVTMDAPCGQVRACIEMVEDQVENVYFDNVPSFVLELNARLNLSNNVILRYDLAFGGAFYAYVDAQQLDLRLAPENYGDIIRWGHLIKSAVASERDDVRHPLQDDLSFLYGVIFVEPASSPEFHSRNVCVFADGEVDRSATGSGVSGRAAIHHARGELEIGQRIRIESIVGSEMSVEIIEHTKFGPHDAVVPRVHGNAWVCGVSEYVLDPTDPFPEGFLLSSR